MKNTNGSDLRALKMIICACLSLAIMAIIFCLSAQTSGESGSLSESIASTIARTFYSGFATLDLEQQREIVQALVHPVRKAAHATEYAVLAASLVATCWQVSMFCRERCARANRSSLERIAGRQFVLGFALSVLYAASDEIHQLFVDGRSGQVADVIIDSCGSLIGSAICFAAIYAIARHLSKKSRQDN